jgi:hypothetical protein
VNGTRPVDLARLALGTAALAGPGLFLRLGRSDDDGRARWTIRVLGGRYVVQSAAGLWLRRSPVRDADAVVDLLHAATMLGLAALVPEYRRLALLSAGAACGFAVADLRGRVR